MRRPAFRHISIQKYPIRKTYSIAFQLKRSLRTDRRDRHPLSEPYQPVFGTMRQREETPALRMALVTAMAYEKPRLRIAGGAFNVQLRAGGSDQKSELAIRAVELDQGLGGSVLSGQSVIILGDGRGDLLGQLLAQLDAPLIVGVQAPHGAFDEGDVLV